MNLFYFVGESFDPRAISSRVLVAGFWFFSSIIMALYTANFAAFLTVAKFSNPITTMKQLASQTDIKVKYFLKIFIESLNRFKTFSIRSSKVLLLILSFIKCRILNPN